MKKYIAPELAILIADTKDIVALSETEPANDLTRIYEENGNVDSFTWNW